MKRIVLEIIKAPVRLYRACISPMIGPRCRFYPTCSAYMLEALETYGPLKGGLLGLRRVASCHPWRKAGFTDPVPKRFTWRDFFGYKRGAQIHDCEQKGVKSDDR